MILETDESLRLNRARILSQEGYNVTGASCIEEATEETRQKQYDLLIVGAGEPEQLDALLTPLPPEISVLMLATVDTIGHVVEHAGTGIHSFLLEPFSQGKFKSTVARIINSTRLVKGGIRSEILTSLAHANWALTSESETEQFFKRIVEIIAADTEAESVVLLIKDEVTGKLVTRSQIGKPTPELQVICNRVIDAGEAVLIDKTIRDTRLRLMMSNTGATAIMCVPLLIKGSVVGAIDQT